MNFQQDWLMRQIEMLVQVIARVVFKKDYIKYEIVNEADLSQTDLLYNEIKQLIARGKVCEAEDLLFEMMDTKDMRYLELAIDFYQQLNLLGDSKLEQCNFSRDEVNDGLVAVLKMFGFHNLIP